MRIRALITVVIAGLLSSCTSSQDRLCQLFQRIENSGWSGDFPKPEQAEAICPDLSVLLQVTKADVCKFWKNRAAGRGEKLEAKDEEDIYFLAALSVVLAEKQRHQDYVLAQFDEIRHPDLKDIWAVTLFNKGRRSPALIKHLKNMIATADSTAYVRGGMTAEQWQELAKRVTELPEQGAGIQSRKHGTQP